MRRPLEWNASSENATLQILMDSERALPRVEVVLGLHFPRSHANCSECSCCVSPSPPCSVAVYSTPLAITAHLAPELGFLGGEALPSRVRQQGCVERQMRASRRMFWFVIWTWGPEVTGARRLEVQDNSSGFCTRTGAIESLCVGTGERRSPIRIIETLFIRKAKKDQMVDPLQL